MTHDALNAPLHILRAMYELQMKRTDSFFLEVQKRYVKVWIQQRNSGGEKSKIVSVLNRNSSKDKIWFSHVKK